MLTPDDKLLCLINDAKLKFNQYAETQTNFQAPQAHISIESEKNDTTKVHIDVEYNGIQYHFESVEEKDINNIYQYLNSQHSVRAKYASGNTPSLKDTTARIHTLINRFKDKNSRLYLYSGFTVSDSQTDMFLGCANLGSGSEPGTSEMAFLNRQDCWSHPIDITSTDTLTDMKNLNKKIYSGIGTVEVCTLLQYGARLKQDGYTIDGHPLKSIVATARLDNEGSWKSCAKAGMTLYDVGVVDHYGSKIRYQLQKIM
ncbi:unnamed protein product [Adineta steineri]|uniref:Uncharacterized protein n=1 Tax=Adineta steineri TaxID=433720 RepID=A0A814GJJ5_9BILA|nr:unnamed protein product [Adineta steineri]CAF3905055.1 unnamed protein product [Adineta steineri]